MKCRKAGKLIFELLDNALSDTNRAWLETHLRECGSCERLAAEMRESLGLVRNLPLVEPSENFNWTLRLKLAREKHTLQSHLVSYDTWIRKWNLRFVLGSVAAFVLVVAGGYVFLESHAPGQGRFATPTTASHPVLTAPDHSVAGNGNTFSEATPVFSFPGRVGERFVSQGSSLQRSGHQSYQAIDEEGAPSVLSPDSLVSSKLRDMRAQYRMRYMERQIELLQEYLRQCQIEQR